MEKGEGGVAGSRVASQEGLAEGSGELGKRKPEACAMAREARGGEDSAVEGPGQRAQSAWG